MTMLACDRRPWTATILGGLELVFGCMANATSKMSCGTRMPGAPETFTSPIDAIPLCPYKKYMTGVVPRLGVGENPVARSGEPTEQDS